MPCCVGREGGGPCQGPPGTAGKHDPCPVQTPKPRLLRGRAPSVGWPSGQRSATSPGGGGGGGGVYAVPSHSATPPIKQPCGGGRPPEGTGMGVPAGPGGKQAIGHVGAQGLAIATGNVQLNLLGAPLTGGVLLPLICSLKKNKRIRQTPKKRFSKNSVSSCTSGKTMG